MLTGERGFGRNICGRGGEVMHPDVIWPRDLSGDKFVALGNLC
jgi:hypothetical protein